MNVPNKISFLLPDSAGPVMGPVTVLAAILSRHFDVEVAAPDFGRGLPPMYRDHYPYHILDGGKGYRLPDYLWQVPKWGGALKGDLIIAVKAVADTVPVALWKKWTRGTKVLAYLDEWDGAVIRQQGRGAMLKAFLTRPHLVLDEHYYPLVERMLPLCDGVLCTSRWLAERFDGDIVHMGVDTETFKPLSDEEKLALRKEHGLEGQKLVVFGGVPREHKGVDLIAESVAMAARDDLKLVVVGPVTDYLKNLMEREHLGECIVALGPRPKEEMPRFLGMADMVVLPFRDTMLARSQVPCKIFEAMAMGLPLIATSVSDLPELVGEDGWLVPPSDPAKIAEAMLKVLDNPSEAARRGTNLRQRCVEQYSQAVTEEKLVEVIRALFR